VDISGILFASAFASRRTKNGSVIDGTLQAVGSLFQNYQPDEMVICWDAGHSGRHFILPEYKGSRRTDTEIRDLIVEKEDLIFECLDCLPVKNLRVRGFEADDLIGEVVSYERDDFAIIISNDRDLYQLANHNTKQHTLYSDPVTMGIKPKQVVMYKSIVGDVSDNVKGITGIGEKKVKGVIAQHKSITRLIKHLKESNERFGRMDAQEAIDRLQRNQDLMTLDGRLLPQHIKEEIRKQYTAPIQSDFQELHRLFTENNLKKLLRRFDRFVSQFE